jgi:hypothetical protein
VTDVLELAYKEHKTEDVSHAESGIRADTFSAPRLETKAEALPPSLASFVSADPAASQPAPQLARLAVTTLPSFFGFWAEKRGHFVHNWKERYFWCNRGASSITYWDDESVAKTDSPDETSEHFKGVIHVKKVEYDPPDPSSDNEELAPEHHVRVTASSGKLFRLRTQFPDDAAKLNDLLLGIPAGKGNAAAGGHQSAADIMSLVAMDEQGDAPPRAPHTEHSAAVKIQSHFHGTRLRRRLCQQARASDKWKRSADTALKVGKISLTPTHTYTQLTHTLIHTPIYLLHLLHLLHLPRLPRLPRLLHLIPLIHHIHRR